MCEGMESHINSVTGFILRALRRFPQCYRGWNDLRRPSGRSGAARYNSLFSWA